MKRNTIKYLLYLFCLSAGFLCGCDDDNYSDEPFDLKKEDIMIYDWIKERPELSLYREIADYSGFYSSISTWGTYTVFVPDNAAFRQLFSELKISAYQEKSPEYWNYYMKYHALESKLHTNSLQGGTMTQATMMGSEYFLTVDISNYYAIKLNNTATIIDSLSNRETRNGYVNVVNAVLQPPVETIYDLLTEHGGYTRMLGLFEKHGLLGYLTDSAVTILIEPDIVFEDPERGMNPDTLSNIREWLSYHILPEKSFISDLNGRCVQSLYEKDVMTFNYDNQEIRFYCNQQDYFSNRKDYPVNVNALNGIYHSMGVPLRIRQHTAGIVRYNLYGRTNDRKGYAQNVFAELPAYIREHVGYNSYHQGINTPEPPICYLVTTQIGDIFSVYIPDVVPGIYQVKMIYNPSICTNLMMSYNGQLINSNINMHSQDGDFPEYTTLKVKNCGQIDVRTTETAWLRFQTLETSGLLMDMIELVPYVSFDPEF